MTLRETILQEALSLFLSEGSAHLTDEELADRLDISYSTLHEMFPNKAELIKQVVQYDIQVQVSEQTALLQKAGSAVEKIMHLLLYGLDNVRRVKSDFVAEVINNYPGAWQLYLQHLQTYSYHQLYDIINKGILEGHFRKDINIQLVVKIILEQVQMLLNPVVFPPEKYDLSEVFRSIFLYYIRGICTDTGGKLSEEFFARNNR